MKDLRWVALIAIMVGSLAAVMIAVTRSHKEEPKTLTSTSVVGAQPTGQSATASPYGSLPAKTLASPASTRSPDGTAISEMPTTGLNTRGVVCGSWSAITLPDLVDEKGMLMGVAATGPNDAWAVGWIRENPNPTWIDPGAPARDAHALILHWDGSQWRRNTDPLPAFSTLSSIAAISDDDVWAVGASLGMQALIIHWDGKSWREVPLGKSGNMPYALVSVSGTATDDVWAVGPGIVGDLGISQILHWDGYVWSNVPGPEPIYVTPTPALSGIASSVSSYNLTAVVAISRSEAWAVGTAGNPYNMWYSHALILRWDGSAWSYSSARGGLGNLLGVGTTAAQYSSGGTAGSIASQGFADKIWAVGWAGDQRKPGSVPRASSTGVIVQGKPGVDDWQWMQTHCPDDAPHPCNDMTESTIIDTLRGVASTASNDAWAVGDRSYTPPFGPDGSTETALFEHWDGVEWWVIPLKLANKDYDAPVIQYSSLEAITAVPANPGTAGGDLWAVGRSGQLNERVPLIVHFSRGDCHFRKVVPSQLQR